MSQDRIALLRAIKVLFELRDDGEPLHTRSVFTSPQAHSAFVELDRAVKGVQKEIDNPTVVSLESRIPEGWVLNTLDASTQHSMFNKGPGHVRIQLTRTLEGKKWWHSLDEEGRDAVELYVNGQGDTFESALQAAIDYTLKCVPTPPKDVLEKIR